MQLRLVRREADVLTCRISTTFTTTSATTTSTTLYLLCTSDPHALDELPPAHKRPKCPLASQVFVGPPLSNYTTALFFISPLKQVVAMAAHLQVPDMDFGLNNASHISTAIGGPPDGQTAALQLIAHSHHSQPSRAE